MLKQFALKCIFSQKQLFIDNNRIIVILAKWYYFVLEEVVRKAPVTPQRRCHSVCIAF